MGRRYDSSGSVIRKEEYSTLANTGRGVAAILFSCTINTASLPEPALATLGTLSGYVCIAVRVWLHQPMPPCVLRAHDVLRTRTPNNAAA